MGNMYLTGHGIPQDLEKAVQYFNVSAQMKCSSGQYWLGICYLKGWGIYQDMNAAIYWLQQAAQQNNQAAIEELQKLGYNY